MPSRKHLNGRVAVLIVFVRVVVDARELQVIVPKVHHFSKRQVARFVQVEGTARETDKNRDNAQVHQVSAVAPCIPPGQLKRRVRQRNLFLGLDRAGAFPELATKLW